MKTLSIRNVLAVLIVGVLLGTAYFTNSGLLKAPEAKAVGENVSGYAWSDTIGWVELSGSWLNGVSISPLTGTGVFSGSAWSENVDTTVTPNQGGVGWISFDRTKTGNPPSAPYNGGSGPIAQVDWATGNVTGWARALSACQNDLVDGSGNCTGSGAGNASGGWDGWIKLSGSWTNGVHIDPATGKFSGYAWGGAQVDAGGNSIPGGVSVIGWIKFAADGTASDGAACVGVTNDYLNTTKCNYGAKGPVSSCSNGANNSPTCSQCPVGEFYNTISSQCYPCSGAGCGTCGGTIAVPIPACLTCNSGATNPPSCDVCPGTQVIIAGVCAQPPVTPATTKTHFWQF